MMTKFNRNFTRKGLYLDDEDQRLIEAIKQRYGCVSESQAVRLALRALVARPLLPSTPLPPAGKSGPKPTPPLKEQEKN